MQREGEERRSGWGCGRGEDEESTEMEWDQTSIPAFSASQA